MAFGLAVEGGLKRGAAVCAEVLLAAVPFRVDVVRERGGVRVCPVGEVDMATIDCLREHVDEAMATGAGRVTLDLRQTTFLDSTGLRLAVETDMRAARNGTEFSIIAGPPAVQRTFDISGLGHRLPFVDASPGQLRAAGTRR